MEFRVLGPLEITHDGEPVIVTRHKCRSLLALFLSHYPYAISTDAVAEALWPDTDPEKAINSVRVNASYLRAALALTDGDGPITSGRYGISVGREHIDVTRFEDLASAAHEAGAAGDPHRATELFGSALAEWRGEPYADFSEIDALREEVARLGELRLDALEGYATALLDDDRADEVCRLLTPVIDAHLSRETLVGRLMLGFHRTGRQRDALAIFARVKDELAESGMPPTPQLQELANAVVLHDPDLDAARSAPRANRRVLAPRRRATFIGRDDELRALQACWDNAMRGAPQLVYVAGEAGMGKTTLIRRFVEQVNATGETTAIGACDPDSTEDYEPFPDLVRSILHTDPPTDSGPSMLGELALLAPDLSDQLPEIGVAADPSAGRQRLFRAVANLLTAPTHPLLLVLEDLHWARPDAVHLLRHVVRQARGQVMILATFRRSELLTPEAYGLAGMTGRLTKPDLMLQLAPMDHHEVRAIIDAVAPRDRRTEWLSELEELTTVSAGNPLRLREVLRQLELEPDAIVAEIAPEDVRSLIGRRMRGLDPVTRSTLHAAAVLGRTFTLPQVATVAELTIDTTLDALDLAIEQGLLAEGDRVDNFTFAHPVFRNAIYSSLVQSRRARLHIRCGEALIDERDRGVVEPTAADIARHFVAARPVSDAGRTTELTREAASDAAGRYAHDEAVEWYRQALECAQSARWAAHDLARIRLARGIELDLSGVLTAARTEYFLVADIARATKDSALLVDTAVAAAPRQAVTDLGFATQLAGLVDEALSCLHADDPARVQLLRSAAFARFCFDPGSAEGYAREAERLSTFTADPEIHNWTLGLRYLTKSNDDEQRLVLSRELLQHSRRHNLDRHRGDASRRILIDHLMHGQIDEFEAEIQAMDTFARAISDPFDQYWVAALTATRALMQSASSATEELINAAAILGRQLQIFDTTGVHMLQMFALRYQQGRSGEVTAGLSEGSTDMPPIMAGTALLALSYAESGRLDLARRALDRVVSRDEILLPRDNFWLGAVGLFSGVAAVCGTAGQRRRLRAGLEPRADRFCIFGAGGAVFGTGHHWLARLARADGDIEAARQHLESAARVCHDARAQFWADRARNEAESIVDP